MEKWEDFILGVQLAQNLLGHALKDGIRLEYESIRVFVFHNLP